MKMRNLFMKSALLLVLIITLGFSGKSEAWSGSKSMGPFRCTGSAYTFYARINGGATLIGTMRITKHSNYVANYFMASIYCNATVAVSETELPATADWPCHAGPETLQSGECISVAQMASSPSDAYGKGVVLY